MAKKEAPKKVTTVGLLQEILAMLEPINNLARFNIHQINLQAQANAEAQKKEGHTSADAMENEAQVKKLEISENED